METSVERKLRAGTDISGGVWSSPDSLLLWYPAGASGSSPLTSAPNSKPLVMRALVRACSQALLYVSISLVALPPPRSCPLPRLLDMPNVYTF